MSTAVREVHTAIYGALVTDDTMFEIGVKAVYDDIPENAQFPYVQIRIDQENNQPTTQDDKFGNPAVLPERVATC